MSDWRLQGQERYLQRRELQFLPYRPYREGWDHDHCEFCGGKFALGDGDFVEGYATTDHYHWICRQCFVDFEASFQWVVVG